MKPRKPVSRVQILRTRARKRTVKAIRKARSATWERCSELFGRPLHRHYLPEFLNQLNLTGSGAEIGVKRGSFSEVLLSRWQGRKLYLVDSWREEEEEEYLDSANVAQSQHDAFYEQTIERLSRFDGRFTIIRDFSVTAARMIPDESLDFVYIDARHDYDSVLEDLYAWEAKVRVGGLIAGHDYLDGRVGKTVFGVKPAVQRFMKDRGYAESAIGQTWEPWPSFYWIRSARD